MHPAALPCPDSAAGLFLCPGAVLGDDAPEGVDSDADGGGGILAHVLVQTGKLPFLVPDDMEAAAAAAAQRIGGDKQGRRLHLRRLDPQALPDAPFFQQRG